MIAKLINPFIVFALIMLVGLKNVAAELTSDEKASLGKIDLVLLVKNNNRVKIEYDNKGRPIVAPSKQKMEYSVNLNALLSTQWKTQERNSTTPAQYVNRKQLLDELYGRDISQEFKRRIESELKKVGMSPISWNEGYGGLSSEADAEVLLKIDLESSVGQKYNKSLNDKSMVMISEVSAVKLYEQIVLGKNDLPKFVSIEINNNGKNHIVGVLSYDRRQDRFTYIMDKKLSIQPGYMFKADINNESCEGQDLLVLVMSNATLHEANMRDFCDQGVINDLSKMKIYNISSIANTKQSFINLFYSLPALDFKKTKGNFNNGRLTGTGWTSFHGDYSVAEFKNGIRSGKGVYCEVSGDGFIANVVEYVDGFFTKSFQIPIQRNRINKDPYNNFAPIAFDDFFKKVCLWE